MKKVVKTLFYLIILFINLYSLTACTLPLGVEEYAYVVAIGLDSLTGMDIEFTLQFATAGSSDSSGSSMQSTKNNITSVKCTSIDSGITLINSHISKKINLSHCKQIVICEELAKKGIEDYLDTLINNTELTNDAEMIISKCPAKDYISQVEPVFEELLPSYYKAIQKTNNYTAYSTNMNLATFYCLLKDNYYQPYAPLANISESTKSKSSSEFQKSSSDSSSSESGKSEKNESSNTSEKQDNSKSFENSEEKESSNSFETTDKSVNADFIAGDYEIDDKNPTQIIGFAAFNQDKLVGEFTGLDCLCFSLINNQLKESIISIPSPFEEHENIELSSTSAKKTKCKVNTENGNSIVHVQVYLTGFGQSMDEQTSYSNEESISKIKESAEKYMQERIEYFLYKTSKEYNSDVCGFGRFAVKNHLTMEEWDSVQWLENYKNCEFDVNVSFNIKAGNVFSET